MAQKPDLGEDHRQERGHRQLPPRVAHHHEGRPSGRQHPDGDRDLPGVVPRAPLQQPGLLDLPGQLCILAAAPRRERCRGQLDLPGHGNCCFGGCTGNSWEAQSRRSDEVPPGSWTEEYRASGRVMPAPPVRTGCLPQRYPARLARRRDRRLGCASGARVNRAVALGLALVAAVGFVAHHAVSGSHHPPAALPGDARSKGVAAPPGQASPGCCSSRRLLRRRPAAAEVASPPGRWRWCCHAACLSRSTPVAVLPTAVSRSRWALPVLAGLKAGSAMFAAARVRLARSGCRQRSWSRLFRTLVRAPRRATTGFRLAEAA